MKKLGKILLAIIALVVIVILTLPIWDTLVLRPIANAIAPHFTNTPFHIDEMHINEFNGRFEMNGMTLYNPPEYEEKVAFSMGHLLADLDMSTVLSDVIVIENVEFKDVFVSYVKDDKGINNFDQIISNVDGGYDLRDDAQRQAYEAKKVEAKAQNEVKAAEKVTKANEAKAKYEQQVAEAKAAGKPIPREKKLRFIIKRLEISNVLVQWGKLTMPVPPITLTDIGAAENGISPDEVWALVYATFWRSLSALGISLKDIGVDVGNMAGVLKDLGVENTDKALEAIKGIKLDEHADAVGEGAKQAVEVFKGLFK